MLSYNDPRWENLKGGYSVPYDPRPALSALETGDQIAGTWDVLWQELHHQGDVGEASYAAIPHLVRIHREVRPLGWNLFALVSTVEVERHRTSNPPLPPWLADGYHAAWKRLLDAAAGELERSNDPLEIRSIVAFVCLARGQLKLGALLNCLDESEIDELVEQRLAWSELYG